MRIGTQHPLRIGHACLGGEGDVVDIVAAIAGQLDAADTSVSAERGLANWPAMRPSFTTGSFDAQVSTTAIWRMTRKVSRMLFALCSAKLSAQSPPWSRKPRPAATSASSAVRLRASPAKTSGG